MPGFPKRILLVEDNRVHARLMRSQIAAAPCPTHVEWVQDGEEALQKLNGPDSLPDLVLLDLKLPRMDGHEVLRRVRESDRLRFIPIVMITTSERKEDMHGAYAEGVNAYLVKPTDFTLLRQMLIDVVTFWCNWNRVLLP